MSVRKVISALSSTLLAATMLGVAGPASAAAPALPAGFVLTDLPTGQGTFNLTDFTYLPDTSVLTAGKNGTVTWLPPGGSAPRVVAQLSAFTGGDAGLLGIAVPPDFATSRHVYTSRAVPAGSSFTWRISRWTLAGDPAPTTLRDERTLLQVPGNTNIHGMSNIEVDSSGTLWISMGDSGSANFADPFALRAQDLDQPYGKLLRITPDGAGVPSNPYYQQANPDSVRSKVYASGLRSPFRFSLDPAGGTPILGDVGWGTFEEINLVRPGQNYKWPCWEGTVQTPGYRDMAGCANVANNPPLWSYPRTAGVSVTGGVVYRGSSYPQHYHGSYFFGDYASHTLWTLNTDANGNLSRTPESAGFGRDIGAPVSFHAAPNGDIVYADIATGNLRRLSYTPGNVAPVAKIATDTDPAARTVSFDGTGSVDFDGDELAYAWDFGDGTTGTGPTATHTYAGDPAAFTATLTVTDRLGASNSTTVTVVPGNHGPRLQLAGADPGARYAVGEPVSLTATAADPEDGPLDVEWASLEVHCSTEASCHAHPGPAAAGPEYTTAFTDHPDTRMEITATATDSAGVRVSETYVAQPRRHRLTLVSTAAARLTISPGTAGTALVTVGSPVTVEASANALDGVATFDRWSNGASRSHTMTMPDADVELAATYLTPIDRHVNGNPEARAILGAPTGPELADGPIRYRDHTGGRLYWTAATGAREVHGSILTRYLTLGAHAKFGVPTTDETRTPDGVGRYNHFTGTPATMTASIYWTPATGAHAVWGLIRQRWAAMSWERGVLDYPISSETGTPDGVGRFNHFTGTDGLTASIYWTPGTGAQPIWGAIRQRWAALGWERGVLGYPTIGETVTPDRYGRYNHFTGNGMPASIYWTPATGAQDVYGMIRLRWSALGWERSYLGYPTSGEHGVPGGRRNNFQRGYVFWDARTGATFDRRY